VTPVYFGEPSETFKAMFDRLRRCEATKPETAPSVLAGKPVIVIAAAGGSGGGAVQCLFQIERLLRQLGASPVDFIPVTQKTREYQLETIHDALVKMSTAPQQTMQAPPAAPDRRHRTPRSSPARRHRSSDEKKGSARD
jgi:multimeric flavodoxin WrbA